MVGEYVKNKGKKWLVFIVSFLLLAGCADSGKQQNGLGSSVQTMGQIRLGQYMQTVLKRLPDLDAAQPEPDSFQVTDSRSAVERVDDRITTYESMEAFLEENGFAGQTPFYQYFDDESGALQLQLYYDESDKTGGGVVYYLDGDPEGGFLFDTESAGEELTRRAAFDPYLFTDPDGYDSAREIVENYQEQAEYTDDGRPLHYLSQGRLSFWEPEDVPEDVIVEIVEIGWSYRGDGTLKSRGYWRNQSVYGSHLSMVSGSYDAQERLVYEWGYTMAGNMEFYYIYSGDNAMPDYYLIVDHNCGWLLSYFYSK